MAVSIDPTLADEDRALQLENLRSWTARTLEIDRRSAESWSIRFEPSDSVFVFVGRFALTANVDRVPIEARIFDELPRGHRVVVSTLEGAREQRSSLLDAGHPTCELSLGSLTTSSAVPTSAHWWIYFGALPGVVLTLFFCRLLLVPRTTRRVPRHFDSTLPFLHERT
ncbi:MAG: hypothetical protein KDC95_03555 [Planctomycetes bacterium]|nr:hypothetical protein [Planctomycetota bacterium]